MTWPGAPTVYYGDEAGAVGWTDPDCRRCYPWGKEDIELIELHRQLIGLRRSCPVLRTGSVLPLGAGNGWIAYSRFDDEECIIVICNNGFEAQELSINVRKAEAEDGDHFDQIFRANKNGHSNRRMSAGRVQDGSLVINAGPQSALILKKNIDRSARKIKQLHFSPKEEIIGS
jgi:alpha-glucosidase